jgi:nucleoside-diphosphate-sugar epimerase
MKVLVFGGSGFIGRRVVAAFATAGHQTFSLDVAPTSYFADHKINAAALGVDIGDFEAVVAAMSTHKPDAVVNLSYMRETTPRAAFRVNVLGMDNCLEAARLCGISRVVYTSSIVVNGRQKHYGDRAITETDATFPTYQYAVHKVFNEWQAKEYREKHGMSVTGIRVAHAAAPDKLVGAVDHVKCIVGPARGHPVNFPFMDTRRCLVHVDDIAHIIVRVTLKEKPDHAIYNSGGETLSLGELADMVRSVITNADITFGNEAGGDEHSVAYRFDNSRLTREFGIALPPYRERVMDMIAAINGKRPMNDLGAAGVVSA